MAKIVGLTGNISSGKTAVGMFFKEFGAEVINADKIVHKLYETNKPLIRKIGNCFGHSVINKKRTINRMALGNIVFEDKKKLKKLISIVWPYVNIEIGKAISKSRKAIIVIEATFLFEAGWGGKLDCSVLVRSPLDKRLERLHARERKFTKGYAEKVIKSQKENRFEGIKFDFVIDNNSTMKDLKSKVKNVWRIIDSS